MNRVVQYFNLLGVVLLAGLSVAQWLTNSRLNLQINRLEQKSIDQQAKIDDQQKTLLQNAADLDDFRGRLKISETSLDHALANLTTMTGERNQLKSAVTQYTAALAQRDQVLKHSNEQMQTLAADRNAAVTKFNDLANKYNAVVKQLNDLQAHS